MWSQYYELFAKISSPIGNKSRSNSYPAGPAFVSIQLTNRLLILTSLKYNNIYNYIIESSKNGM